MTKEPEKNTDKDRKTEVVDRGPKRGMIKAELAALKLHVESEKFLERRRERTRYKEAFDKIIGKVNDALATAKQEIDKIINNAIPSAIAVFTNAWKAWKGGNLESYLAPQYRTARQLWRTEMVAYIAGKLEASPRQDKAAVMEAILAAQTVTEFEDDPAEALKTAMHLDPKIKALRVRKDLAEKMAKSAISGDLAYIRSEYPMYTISRINVVVGGNFISIPPEQAANFKFMRMVLDKKENRIYAQMENGCRGNLVIIELTQPAGPEGTSQPLAPRSGAPEGTPQPPAPRPRKPEGTLQPPAPRIVIPPGPTPKFSPSWPEGTPQQPAPRTPAEGTPQPAAPRTTPPEGTKQPAAPRPRKPEGTLQPPAPRSGAQEGTPQQPAPRPRKPEGTLQPPAPRPGGSEGTPQQPAPRTPAEGTPQSAAPRSTTSEGTKQPAAPRSGASEGTKQPQAPRTPAEGTLQPAAPRTTPPEGTKQPPAPRSAQSTGTKQPSAPRSAPEGTPQSAAPRKVQPPERGESDDARPPPE